MDLQQNSGILNASMYSADFIPLVNPATGEDGIPNDAMSSNRPRNIPFDDAVDLADIGQADATLREVSTDGVLDWDRFDIVPFAALLPSIAILDREEREDGSSISGVGSSEKTSTRSHSSRSAACWSVTS